MLVQQAPQALPAAFGHEVEEAHVAGPGVVVETHLGLAHDAFSLPQVRVALGHLRDLRLELLHVERIALAHLLVEPIEGTEAREVHVAPERDAGLQVPRQHDRREPEALRRALEAHHGLGLAALVGGRLPAPESRLLEGADRRHVALRGPRDARLDSGLREHHLVHEAPDRTRSEAPAEEKLVADEEVDAGHGCLAAEALGVFREEREGIRLDVAHVLPVHHDDAGAHRALGQRSRAVLCDHLGK